MKEDIVVTWPKNRPLDRYLEALANAQLAGEEISFRVPNLPRTVPMRCYRVHDGAVRGWTRVKRCEWRERDEVKIVGDEDDDRPTAFWPAGYYVVCEPVWHPIEPIPMRGFRGWSWFERDE